MGAHLGQGPLSWMLLQPGARPCQRRAGPSEGLQVQMGLSPALQLEQSQQVGPRADNQEKCPPGWPVYTLPLGLPPSGLTMSLPGHLLPVLVLLLGESSGLAPGTSGGSGAGPTEKEGFRPWMACSGGRR